MTEKTTKITQVAVGVLRRADGRFLLANRPDAKNYAGYWEFPGGKLEPGESPEQALVRELEEEIGIRVTRAYPWIRREFHYPHVTVNLHFFQVWAWEGTVEGREGQQYAWCDAKTALTMPLLPANVAIVPWMRLPPLMAVSQITELGGQPFVPKLEARLRQGLRLLVLREPGFTPREYAEWYWRLEPLCRKYRAEIIVHGELELARVLNAAGVHLPSGKLADLGVRPNGMWVGASCHDAYELAMAERLGLDYAWLSPVAPTLSHPEAQVLGWPQFAEWVNLRRSLPVYALGGMHPADLNLAREHGAHGVACMRSAWDAGQAWVDDAGLSL